VDKYYIVQNHDEGRYNISVPQVKKPAEPLSIDQIKEQILDFAAAPYTPPRSDVYKDILQYRYYNRLFDPRSRSLISAALSSFTRFTNDTGRYLFDPKRSLTLDEYALLEQARGNARANKVLTEPVRKTEDTIFINLGHPSRYLELINELGTLTLQQRNNPVLSVQHEMKHYNEAHKIQKEYGLEAVITSVLILNKPYVIPFSDLSDLWQINGNILGMILGVSVFVSTPMTGVDYFSTLRGIGAATLGSDDPTTFHDKRMVANTDKILNQGITGLVIERAIFDAFASEISEGEIYRI
jgi:hypothetical protein